MGNDYYGDEAGLYGYGDPFCRGTYPWGKEDKALIEFYKTLGKIRRGNKAFASGEFVPVRADRGFIAFMRKNGGSTLFIAINRNDFYYELPLPDEISSPKTLAGAEVQWGKINLPPNEFTIISNE